MSERILNGDFSLGSAYWTNPAGVGLAFSIGAGTATGASNPSGSLEWTYKMCQQFSSNDEIITAVITVWAGWEAYSDYIDGHNQFIVELEKPDTTMVSLVDTTKTAVVGSGNILSASDISAHMATYGNYKLWLTLKTKSARTAGLPPEREYIQSQGWYDNISINIAVKKYKTVHEKLGSSGKLNSEARVSRSEIVGLYESYSTEVYSPVFSYETASESVGLIESYSTLLKRQRGAVEVVGLKEGLQILRKHDNMETTYTLGDLTHWDETSRVDTPWIKKQVVIVQK